jgi:hypothetical protein
MSQVVVMTDDSPAIVNIANSNFHKLTFGRLIKIKSFTGGATTTIEFFNDHCLSSGDKIVLFATEGQDEESHDIADGQLFTVTVTTSKIITIPLNTSVCTPTDGIAVVPYDYSLFTFSTQVKTKPVIVGNGNVTATDGSKYLFFDSNKAVGIESGRLLSVEGAFSSVLIEDVGFSEFEIYGRCQSGKFATVASAAPATLTTNKWKTDPAPTVPTIAASIDVPSATITLSIDQVIGDWEYTLKSTTNGFTKDIVKGVWIIR